MHCTLLVHVHVQWLDFCATARSSLCERLQRNITYRQLRPQASIIGHSLEGFVVTSNLQAIIRSRSRTGLVCLHHFSLSKRAFEKILLALTHGFLAASFYMLIAGRILVIIQLMQFCALSRTEPRENYSVRATTTERALMVDPAADETIQRDRKRNTNTEESLRGPVRATE